MNLKEFVNPSKRYRPSPFWSWNNVMDAAEVETRVREMKRKGFGGFFVHARPGLRTRYMEDDWMRAVRRAVETARETGMECWFCDEDRWPSGYGGGKTTEGADELLACALIWYEDASSLEEGILENAILYTRRGDDGSMEPVTEKPGDPSSAGVFVVRRFSRGHPWYNGENYPDLLDRRAAGEFIVNTHERYAKLFRYDFGEFLPGIFTMEPNVNRSIPRFEGDEHSERSFPWSPDFPGYFKTLHGYSPVEHLHRLLDDSEEGFRFRHDYWLTVAELFLKSFTIPVSEWCRGHDFKLTGHFYDDGDFRSMVVSGGDVMAHYEYMDVPGIAHRGRSAPAPWTVKQASSVANQLDKERTAARIFVGAGQSLDFEDIKRLADLHFALGVDFLCPHLVHYSLQGDRKRDHPPTFSYHQPYWEHMRVINDYLGRCSWAVSMGESTASVLVMVPVTSAYGSCRMGSCGEETPLRRMEKSYHALVEELTAEHLPFDLGSERILKRHGVVENDTLRVGRAAYSAVVLPPSMTWSGTTVDLLESFGGAVILMGEVPARVDGVESDRLAALAARENVAVVRDEPSEVVAHLCGTVGRTVSVTGEDGGEARDIAVNHRKEAGAHLLFLANTDRDTPKEVTISVKAVGGVVELDPLSGRAFRYAAELEDGGTVIRTVLHPAGSRIFLIDQTQTSVDYEPRSFDEEPLSIEGPYAFQRNHDNSLTIDRCSLAVDGRTVMENAPLRKVKETVWKMTGIDEYRGYQPWMIEKRNVRTRTNETVLTFTFTVKEIPETISLAVESADRFTISINGTEVEPTPGKWFLDKRIPVLDISGHVVEGENVVTAATDFLWDTEIENIYVFGDFAVGNEEDGFPLIREPETLGTGSWTEQGYPFYSGSMTYRMGFDLEFSEKERFEMDLSGVRAANCFVTVNGTEIGSVPFHPYRAEITGALRQGSNTIEIEVFGTLGNILEPPPRGNGGNPDSGRDGEPYGEKDRAGARGFVPYGFIEPPKLVRITETEENETAAGNDA